MTSYIVISVTTVGKRICKLNKQVQYVCEWLCNLNCEGTVRFLQIKTPYSFPGSIKFIFNVNIVVAISEI